MIITYAILSPHLTLLYQIPSSSKSNSSCTAFCNAIIHSLTFLKRKMSSSTSNQGGGIFDNSTVLISVWMVALFLFLCFPFCVNKRSRMLCRKRIQERRWDVHLGAEHDEMWYRIATQRYDRYRYVFVFVDEILRT